MGTYGRNGYGLEVGKEVNLSLEKVANFINENCMQQLNLEESLIADEFDSLSDLIFDLGLKNTSELMSSLVNNILGGDLVEYTTSSSGKDWFIILPRYPWEVNNYSEMTQLQVVSTFLETIESFVEQDIEELAYRLEYYRD